MFASCVCVSPGFRPPFCVWPLPTLLLCAHAAAHASDCATWLTREASPDSCMRKEGVVVTGGRGQTHRLPGSRAPIRGHQRALWWERSTQTGGTPSHVSNTPITPQHHVDGGAIYHTFGARELANTTVLSQEGDFVAQHHRASVVLRALSRHGQ